MGSVPWYLDGGEQLYDELVGKVSMHALRILEDQRVMAESGENAASDCTGLFSKSMGLHCSHTIRRCIQVGMVLRLAVVNRHWWLNTGPVNDADAEEDFASDTILQTVLRSITQRYMRLGPGQKAAFRERLTSCVLDATPELTDPVTKPSKGRPAESRQHHDSSTRRTICAFDREEVQAKRRRCRKCRQVGHNSQTSKTIEPEMLVDTTIVAVCAVKKRAPVQREIRADLPDGNCGFRVLAAALTGDQNNWHSVRAEMVLYVKNTGEYWQNSVY
ncbi:hypothetical protein PsorP6_008159 [Peronosclerospora sorghi]|uniref:Uncharacterized protein n=1 Tax=Peronosclerospora sorghi TaxID=230839 RepID=A0ACC0W6T7_9STRA|nr:hypothetical protein PsorP6_008159 [Peronosclerospora sorghi]